MTEPAFQGKASEAHDNAAVCALCRQLWNAWNRQNSAEFAAAFADDGDVIGFDGSPISGGTRIEAHLREIFSNHRTAAYVGIIRDVRFLTPEVAVLRAVAGMTPPGQTDLNPAVNVMQTLVAQKLDGRWRAILFQSTPAQFHGRPELAEALTTELRQARIGLAR